jgi:hypothetical protein
MNGFVGSAPGRNVSLGYLRTFLVVLVVAHHAVLAYHPYAPPPPKSLGDSLLWSAFPVVDTARWPGVDLFVGFNDTFFMSLLFLISGVFAWSSLENKGRGRFVRDRSRKLGAAFAVAAAVLAPLAYYPTFLTLEAPAASFARQWLGLDVWPAGPAWFLWVLLAFVAVAALVHPRARAWYPAAGRLGRRPFAFFLALTAAGALAYLPMAAAFTSFHWASFGPFFVQTSRVLLYAVFFFGGIALGAHGREDGLLAPGSPLARKWGRWALLALVAFAANVVAFVAGVLPTLAAGGPGPLAAAISNAAFVLSCTASSFAFLALFLRFARRANPIADSLDGNAFGIYLLHYAWVSWLQWLLLPAPLSGAAKGTLVFLGALLASWGLSAAIQTVLLGRAQSGAAPEHLPSAMA